MMGCAADTKAMKGGAMKLDTFGARLLWARRNHAKITQQELKDKMEEGYQISIGKNYISELETETARKRPSFEVVRAMAGALKVSLDYFGRFTEQLEPAYGKESTPLYFSEEADEVAQLVDGMSPDQRALVLQLARSLAHMPTIRERRLADVKEMLESIERRHGKEVRAEVEKVMRNKGLFVDPTS